MIASLLLGLSLPVASAAAQLSPPVVPAPPRTAPAERMLLTWMPGPVTCDRVAVTAAAMRRPLIGLAWAGQREGFGPVTYRFRIDATGRPLLIARDGTGFVTQGEDIAPSLAASRFPAGPARGECAITYRATLSSLATAAVADLMSYSVDALMGPLPAAGWERIAPAGGNCRALPRPQALRQVYPEFDTLPPTPGVRSWSMVGYDIDARGRPINVRNLDGTRNAALDTASVKAMKAWRFTAGTRTGCLYPFWRAPATMAAPASPNRSTITTEDRCPTSNDWTYRQPLAFPESWRRRAIEGWAIVTFDVAPWGDIGNVRIVASEPSTEFGEQALRLLRGAKKPASATGHTGCTERVRFVLDAKAAVPFGDY